ncbi:unnamed protein product [Prunus armeniaca]
MASSIETEGAWSTKEDVSFYEAWLQGRLVRKWHCLVGEKFSIKSWESGEMPWQKRCTTIEAGKIVLTRAMGCLRHPPSVQDLPIATLGQPRPLGRVAVPQLMSRVPHRNSKQIAHLPRPIKEDNHPSLEIIQAHMWFGVTRSGKKSFNHHECWEVVKYCKRFIIILMGLEVMLNETPLRNTMTSDSPIDSPTSQDSPIEKKPRPIGRKAAKAKKAGNSSNNNSKFLEEIARQNAIRIEMEQKHQGNKMKIQAEYAREREYLCKKDEYKTDRETMAMDTSHMSPETKQFWKLERMDVMRRRLF